MRTLALKAFSAMLNPEHFQTGPQVASDVAARLEALAGEPIFSPVVQQIVESLASAIDAKDRYTKNHSEEATNYAEALGSRLTKPGSSFVTDHVTFNGQSDQIHQGGTAAFFGRPRATGRLSV